jgi:diguanylate cyclase (GGDEF)-like protein
MMGKNLSQIPWLANSDEKADIPWETAMRTQANVGGQAFTIAQPDQNALKVIVNAAPIQDARGKLRGCMVTFHDVTQLHHANEQMRNALNALEASREQIEQQNVELVRLAERDSLTGCLNRRALFSTAEPLLGKLRQEARNMACIMADIDYFKRVNDTHGHLIGDQVIVAAARTMSDRMRGADLLCRYGGEEFCIVLPGASEEAAVEAAERMRQEIERQVGPSIRTVEDLHITCSFGVTSLRSGAETLPELIELADFALYASKRSGRNRVTLWTEVLGQKSENPLASMAAGNRA